MSKLLYVGPYLIVPAIEHTQPRIARSCPNGHRLMWSNDPFCPKCGSPVDSKTISEVVTRAPRLVEMGDEWVDHMVYPSSADPKEGGEAIWIPNHSGFTLNVPPTPGVFAIEAASLDFVGMLQRASDYFAPFVTALETKFELKARWATGVLAYDR
jgi:hypothetical protein